MPLDLLDGLLCCPQCRRSLDLQTLDDGTFACDCGQTYPLESRLLDFHVQEQQLANNWSGSFRETEEEEQARLDRWLATGLLTMEDLEQINQAVHPEPVQEALAAGVASLHGHMADRACRVVLDLCTGMGSLVDEQIANVPLDGKLVLLSDLSTTALRQVLDRLQELGVAGSFLGLACDICQLPVRDSAVDLITGIAAVGNLDDGRSAMAEAFRALTPDGRLRLCELLYAPDSRTVRWADYWQPDNLHAYDRLLSSLDDVGFHRPHLEALFCGVAHLKGDFYPLKGDATGVYLVSADKR